jgi:hypothetical protein
MDRAQQFIQLYNQLSRYLREQSDSDANLPFYQLIKVVSTTHSTVRRYLADLKEYGDLRNVIVHNQTYPQQVIAEPTEETIIQFTRMVESITAPKRLIPTFQRKLRLFSTEDLLLVALEYIKNNEFSQIVVQSRVGLSLLSIEGIALWFAEQQRVEMSIGNVMVGDALAHEHPDNALFMARNAFVDDAREAFSTTLTRTHPRLLAIIITNTGKRTEQPLGIITPWDLLQDAANTL